MERFLGGSPAGVLFRLVILSLFVGFLMSVFGVRPRILDGSRAVLLGDLKLSLEAGERELWLIRVRGALEQRLAMVEVDGGIEAALLEAKKRLDD